MLNRRLKLNRRNTQLLIFSQTCSTHSHPHLRPNTLESSLTHIFCSHKYPIQQHIPLPLSSTIKKKTKVQNPSMFHTSALSPVQPPTISPGFCILFLAHLPASILVHLSSLLSAIGRRIIFKCLSSAQNPEITSISFKSQSPYSTSNTHCPSAAFSLHPV